MSELKIGDVVQRFRCQGTILEHEYVIVSETKTEVKTQGGTRFKKKIPSSGHITRIGANTCWYIKKENTNELN